MSELLVLAQVLVRVALVIAAVALAISAVVYLRLEFIPAMRARGNARIRRALSANRRPLPRAIAWLL